jgi:hypothetical protein
MAREGKSPVSADEGPAKTHVEIGAQANQLLREALRFYPTIGASELRLYVLGRTRRLLPSPLFLSPYF